MFYPMIDSKTIDLGCCEISFNINQAAKTFGQPILLIRAGPFMKNPCWEDAQMIECKASRHDPKLSILPT